MNYRLVNHKPIEATHEGCEFKWEIGFGYTNHPKVPPCKHCNGRGEVSHGFGTDDSDRICRECLHSPWGKGTDRSFKWNPEPPRELIKKVQDMCREYWNQQQNEKFKLE